MNAPVEAQAAHQLFSIQPHAQHGRLRMIELSEDALAGFFAKVKSVDVQNLQYVPFMRYILAHELDQALGGTFGTTICNIARDRASGGFTVGVQGVTTDSDDYVKFGTAVAHLLGTSNHDAMSGTYYARFLVKDTDSSDSYLRQAYRLFTLHTDGTYVEEETHWLLMMKFDEVNATGGESRLMHLDDWSERDNFAKDPMGALPFIYKAPGSKNVAAPVERPLFFHSEFGLAMSFIDQFVQPRTITEAQFLHAMSSSMEKSSATKEVSLPAGELVVANNYFWLHGRAPFKKHPELHRELMRQRGTFAK
ncbi:carbon starvation induced protein [Caballeronia calidae]|uniref:Carbon starvation induced protein n=1 Tax=Caballeronia calidae TaxID=1777139 RepID=A0A158EBX2_9BURK|nr:glutarate dioxygenase GlaH [Caballeronia calidae]SAL04375.1 carbon starvation induced protein [Caballeronia calidae]